MNKTKQPFRPYSENYSRRVGENFKAGLIVAGILLALALVRWFITGKNPFPEVPTKTERPAG